MTHVVIVGNGISGITAARHIRKQSDMRITVISGESDFFFSRTALMYIYMGHMTFEDTQPYETHFWKKNRIELLRAFVTKVDSTCKSLELHDGRSLQYDKLVIATGSKSNRFGWPGQDLKGVQGLYSHQDLQLLEENTHVWNAFPSERKVQKAVIVGGGLIGVELTEMLITRGIQVVFLIRENRFWGGVLPKEEGDLVARHLREHGVELLFEEELESISGDDEGKVKELKTKSGVLIPCQLVGLTVGVSPNIGFLQGSNIELGKGVLVNEFLQTNELDVFAVGDCAEFRQAPKGRKAIEQVWYTGRMMGEVVAKTITGENTVYEPGPWFNSAKFFDIEYQTYGNVKSNLSDDESDFYWEHVSMKKCMRLVFHESTRKFLGVNVFGIRMRHEVIDKWLRQERSIDFVLDNLKEANFDPEFFQRHEGEILLKWMKSRENIKINQAI